MRKVSGIYKITNIVNGSSYIGSSINICKRFIRHKCDLRAGTHHSIKLQRSWTKYGEENFVFGILEECSIDKDIILSLEQKYLDKLKPVLNSSPTARNCLGVKHTDATKHKMSKAKLGKSRKHVFTDEVRKNMSDAQKGVPRKPESIAKMKLSKKGKKPPHFDKFMATVLKMVKSEEHRARVSVCHTGRKHSDETIKKKSKPITQYDLNMNKIMDWDSPTFAHWKLGVSAKRINDCCRGAKKTAGGFKWTYKIDEGSGYE